MGSESGRNKRRILFAKAGAGGAKETADATYRSRQTQPSALVEAGLLERTDLQQMIRNSPDEFFAELGEKLLPVGEEIRPSEVVDDRIDLLAVDSEGSIVIIELKRGAHKLQLLQALSYAALISDWPRERLTAERARFSQRTENEVEEDFDEFLDEGSGTLNGSQRVILVAEEYDFQVLATAKWLSERYEIDVACWRAELATDGSSEYLSLACIYPPPELVKAARSRRAPRAERPTRWSNWDEALAAVSNPAVVDFYRARLKENWPSRLRGRLLAFPVDNKRGFEMTARASYAYVWQRGRFDGDMEFWRKRLGPDCRFDSVADGRAIRFFLEKPDEFSAFWRAYREEIPGKAFQNEPTSDVEMEGEGENEA
jgi:hypothetical protein